MRTRMNPRTWSVAWQVFTLQLIVVAVVVLTYATTLRTARRAMRTSAVTALATPE